MAIDEQDFSSLLEQEEQLGCEIDECNIFLWLDLCRAPRLAGSIAGEHE